MKDYDRFYAGITAPFRAHPGAVKALKAVNLVLTAATFVFYPALLLLLLADGWKTGGPAAAVRTVLPYVLVPGTGFVLVSALRKRINEPRPYERWDIDPLIHKDTKGKSMPSRHIFSAAVIAMCALDLSAGVGLLMLFLTLLLAAIRVIGGVHYPADVAAGFGAGLAFGCILLLI